MNDLDLAFAPVTTLSRLLRERRVTSLELARLFLARLDRLGPRYNAVAQSTPDLALQQAAHADALLAAGKAPSPLTGVPYGAKDLLATAGVPTRWGSPAHADQVFPYDATVVKRLADAGAVLVAKLAMVELAGGGGYDSARASLHGPGINPWNRKHWAGGSSSGSGAAVAAGLVPFALGSETWGSIVTPSAFCGITGLRPTDGLVSLEGAMELSWQMDKIGPMARTARDCRIVLDVIAGPAPADPQTTAREQRARPRSVRTLGVLAPPDGADGPVRREFNAALESLHAAGYKTTPASLPERPYNATAQAILGGDIAAAHRQFLADSARLRLLRDARQRRGLKNLTRGSAADYAAALKEREAIRSDLAGLFDGLDALVTPTLAIEATPLVARISKAFQGAGGASVLGSLCGLPEITVPMGSGANGLPLGLSIIGPRYADTAIARVAEAFQRHTAWHGRRPPGVA